MPYKLGYKTVYYVGEEELEKTTGLKSTTGKPVVYSELIKQYNKDNKFVDVDFPTDNSSVEAELLGADPARGTCSFPNWDKSVIWERPQEALRLHNKTNYRNLQPQVDEIKYVFSQPSTKDKSAKSRFDITQGQIADCWFVASLAQITQFSELSDCVVPEDNLDNNDSGCYHFRFFHFGSWVDVVVDDQLPLFELGGPGTGYNIMICNPPHENGVYEVWPLLAEKAYIKLQGSVKQIDLGFPLFALEDLTGGIGDMVLVETYKEKSSQLFNLMNNMSRMSFVALGTSAENAQEQMEKGIAPGHAYCLTGLTTVTYKGQEVQLVRLRNPWGEFEWKGAWSDHSSELQELSDEDKEKVGLVVEEDGEFWISIQDVAENFYSLSCCNWFPEKLVPLMTKQMDIQTYHGELNMFASNANFPWTNPQFVVEVKAEPVKDCLILAHAQLKCKLQQKTQICVRCYQILDPTAAGADGKFAETFFRDPAKSKQYNPPEGGGQFFIQRITAPFKVPPGKYVITVGLVNNLLDEYGFLLTLAGEIVPSEEALSLARQIQLDDKLNTDTGLAKQAAEASSAGDKSLDEILKDLEALTTKYNAEASSLKATADGDGGDILSSSNDDFSKEANDLTALLQNSLDDLDRSNKELAEFLAHPSYNTQNPSQADTLSNLFTTQSLFF